MNKLVREANELLKNGGFNYAFCGGQALDMFLGYESRVHGDIDICVFWEDRDRIIEYMQSKGYKVYEMLGGGRAHPITSTAGLVRLKKNIFCRMEFFHVGQTKLDYIEFLFNDKSATHFEYSRNREVILELEKAILFLITFLICRRKLFSFTNQRTQTARVISRILNLPTKP